MAETRTARRRAKPAAAKAAGAAKKAGAASRDTAGKGAGAKAKAAKTGARQAKRAGAASKANAVAKAKPAQGGKKPAGDDAGTPLSPAADVHSVAGRAAVRDQLEEDVARFLQDGGRVEEVPRNFRADPPRRPENNYGRGSI